MSEAKMYEKTYVMEESLLSPKGNLRLDKLLMLVQEVVIGGSTFVGLSVETVKASHLYWVVMSYRFEIKRMPRLGETIRLQTYPGKTRSFIYPRYINGYDEKGEVIIRAISLWALLNDETHRPVPSEQSHFVPAQPLSFPDELPWPPLMRLGELKSVEKRRVHPSDIDFNGHMNNVRYIDFALDTEPLSFFDEHPITAFQINYSSETRVGANMEIFSNVEGVTRSYQGRVDDKIVFSLQVESK
jgi:medium-chain acyl-[acyl-carrier-protein] hydrolase